MHDMNGVSRSKVRKEARNGGGKKEDFVPDKCSFPTQHGSLWIACHRSYRVLEENNSYFKINPYLNQRRGMYSNRRCESISHFERSGICFGNLSGLSKIPYKMEKN